MYFDLVKLCDTYHGQIDIICIIEPRVLQDEDRMEIEAYYAKRIEASEKLVKEQMAKEEEERKAIEHYEYLQRRESTLSAARQKTKDLAQKYDLRDATTANADHESGYKWDHWIRTKQMTDWYV